MHHLTNAGLAEVISIVNETFLSCPKFQASSSATQSRLLEESNSLPKAVLMVRAQSGRLPVDINDID